ncbi:MAG: magnesium/cobalt efflux protein [Legionellales bacterium]|nr:magnesium/cobalt efflux protein [Legionellales bacterium]
MTDMNTMKVAIPVLLLLMCLSAFFSGSETGMMSLNRYKMRHQSRTSRAARQILHMLKRPDRLLGVILIGNNFANIVASSIATLLCVSLFGENLGIPIATVGLTITLLIFSEIMPKTLAALYPERFAFFVIYPLSVIAFLLSPFVFLLNSISNGLLWLFGVKVSHAGHSALTKEELRTAVHESAARHRLPQSMLIGVLDLETATVEDIMLPKSEITAIDLSDPWEDILHQMANTQHTLLPVYRDNTDNIIGIFHARTALNLMAADELTPETFEKNLSPPYYVPENTPLNQQLLEFRSRKQRFALVVDEYGEIVGIITLADLLKEIVGEFTTDIGDFYRDVHPQPDGSYLFDGSITIRQLNRAMGWHWPQDGPKTLSGLIIDKLEVIPEVGTCLLIKGLPVEVMQVKDNMVKTVKIVPQLILTDKKS